MHIHYWWKEERHARARLIPDEKSCFFFSSQFLRWGIFAFFFSFSFKHVRLAAGVATAFMRFHTCTRPEKRPINHTDCDSNPAARTAAGLENFPAESDCFTGKTRKDESALARDAAAAKRERLSAQTFTTSAGGESTDPPQKRKSFKHLNKQCLESSNTLRTPSLPARSEVSSWLSSQVFLFLDGRRCQLYLALSPLLKCCQSLPSAATVPRGSGREVRLLGLSEGGNTEGGGERKRTSPRLPPASPFSPTASIKLCQLLPRAKACLRETDLKGLKSTEQLHCGVTAPPPRLAGDGTAAAEGRERERGSGVGSSGSSRALPTLTGWGGKHRNIGKNSQCLDFASKWNFTEGQRSNSDSTFWIDYRLEVQYFMNKVPQEEVLAYLWKKMSLLFILAVLL